jgi:hypothetical protein
MRFSKVVFLIAGIWGIIVLLPGYFTEQRFAAQFPPPVTHPEFYYGFYGVALAWQLAFLIIAGDPARFRGIIPAAVLEKLSYAGTIAALFATGRVGSVFAAFGLGDLIFGILFMICYARLHKPAGEAATAN